MASNPPRVPTDEPPAGGRAAWERPAVALLMVLGLVAVFGVHRDVGVSWDEAVELFEYRQGETNWRFWAAGMSPDDARFDNGHSPFILLLYYGAEVLGRSTGWSPNPIDTFHWMTGLFGVLGFLFAWRLARRELPAVWALLAALLVVSWPRYVGHSLANFKDLPFAVAWLAVLDFGIRAAERPTWGNMCRAGAAFGVLLAFRLGGLVFAPVALVLLWVAARRDPDPRLAIRLARTCAVSLGALGFAYLAMPYLLLHPVDGLLELLAAQGKFVWTGTTLTAGVEVAATEMPRWYVPAWLLVTLPVGVLAVWGVGAGWWLLDSVRRGPPRMSLVRLGLLLGGGFPLVYVVVAATPVYDGIRHVLFCLPPLMLVGVMTLHDRAAAAGSTPLRGALGGLAVLVVLNVWHTASLHPYQMLYFNELTGGVAGAQGRYSLDYWTITSKETGDWLREHGGHNPSVCVFMGRELSWTPYLPDWEVTDARTLEECQPTQWLVVPNRGLALESLAALRARRRKTWVTEFRVERAGATLAVIARDPRYTPAPIRD